MKDGKSLDKIGGLLESVAAKSVPFLDKCSETKLLAYSDINQAHLQYRELANKALCGSEKILDSGPNCRSRFRAVRSALQQKEMTPDLVRALNNLRNSYMDEILQPAVRGYLSGQSRSRRKVEDLYEKVFRIDGLIEVGQFFKRVDSL